MCFIDYKKAFDSIDRNRIWSSLREQGVSQKYINIINSVYSRCRARIRLEREGAEFPINRGARQGDPLSPKIFTVVLESIFRNLDWEEKGLRIDGEFLSHLRFADDIVVFAENASDLNVMVEELAKESMKAGLLLNSSKTKILTNSEWVDISIAGEKIEYVKDYVYLGQSVSFENCTEKEIQRRIAIAWRKFWSYKEIMKSREIKVYIKKKLFEVAILPCLTYGCQTWALRKEEEEKLAICQRKMERSMLGLRMKDRVSNKTIRNITKLTDIRKIIIKLKWKWAGHVCRLDKMRWTKKVTEWIPRNRKRKRGRQRKRWRDVFAHKVGPDWMRKARDRELWRDLGEAYATEAAST